jgi:hypothetical protein
LRFAKPKVNSLKEKINKIDKPPSYTIKEKVKQPQISIDRIKDPKVIIENIMKTFMPTKFDSLQTEYYWTFLKRGKNIYFTK